MLGNDNQSAINQTSSDAARCDTSAISTARRPDLQHDAHRVIADEWIQRAITGIQQMHLNEDLRRNVAKRIF
jgi:hypothetical protein